MDRSIWFGWDDREADAYKVALRSMLAHSKEPPERRFALDLKKLIDAGIYQRPTFHIEGRLWDEISQAPMSTQFAISRFMVPYLCRQSGQTSGLALFLDCDMMFRAPVEDLFGLADPRYAIQVVKHDYEVRDSVKMDGQANEPYARKNWSSVMIFNMSHPALANLTLAKVNSWAGRNLHAFDWLDDQFLGDLPPEWNHLIGIDAPDPSTALAHFTLGTPSMDGHGDCEFAAEWWSYLSRPKFKYTDSPNAHPFGDGICRHPAHGSH